MAPPAGTPSGRAAHSYSGEALNDTTRHVGAEGDRRRSPLWLGIAERLLAAALLSGTLWIAVAWATA